MALPTARGSYPQQHMVHSMQWTTGRSWRGLGIMPGMIAIKRLFERIVSWSEEDIEKLEDAARAIEAWHNGQRQESKEELRVIRWR